MVETETPQNIMRKNVKYYPSNASNLSLVMVPLHQWTREAALFRWSFYWIIILQGYTAGVWPQQCRSENMGDNRYLKQRPLYDLRNGWLIKILNFAFCRFLWWTVSVQHRSLITAAWAHAFTFSPLLIQRLCHALASDAYYKNILCSAGNSHWWTIVMEINCWKMGNSVSVVRRQPKC